MLSPAAAALAPFVVPLIVAVIGLIATIVGTISGVIITQRRSDRREKVVWEREREREREVWAREDAARTFELRRESYVEYYEAVDALIRDYNDMLVRRGFASIDEEVDEGEGTPESAEERQQTYYSALDRVQLYGSSVALKEVSLTTACITKARRNPSINASLELDNQRLRLLQAIRADLGVPSGAMEPPTSSKPAD